MLVIVYHPRKGLCLPPPQVALLHSIPSYGYSAICLSIHCWWALLFPGTVTNKAAKNIQEWVFVWYPFLLIIHEYLGKKWMSHMVTACLFFLITCQMFSKLVLPSHISTGNFWGSSYSKSSPKFGMGSLLGVLADISWWFNVITNDIEHLFNAHLPSAYVL